MFHESNIKKGEENGEKTGKTEECKNGKIYAVEVNSKESGPKHGRVRGSSLFENLTWLTADEAAEYLRLPSVGMLRVLVCKREIPFHKLGRRLRFKKMDLDRLLESSRKGGV